MGSSFLYVDFSHGYPCTFVLVLKRFRVPCASVANLSPYICPTLPLHFYSKRFVTILMYFINTCRTFIYDGVIIFCSIGTPAIVRITSIKKSFLFLSVQSLHRCCQQSSLPFLVRRPWSSSSVSTPPLHKRLLLFLTQRFYDFERLVFWTSQSKRREIQKKNK